MANSVVWAYRAPADVHLADIAFLYGVGIDPLIRANRHLHDVSMVEVGDLVLLPILCADRTRLPWCLPSRAFETLESIEEVSPFEAAMVRAGMRPHIKNNSDAFVRVDQTLLQRIMNRCAGVTHLSSKLNLATVADALNRSMNLALATNRRREVGFLSQAVIETDYFRTFEEYGRGAGKQYHKYYGRGMHQLTWEETYTACSKALFGDDRLVEDPDMIVKDIEVNIKATAWFWRDYKPFNELADTQNIDEIIHKLYGGTIGSRSEQVRTSVRLRRKYYKIIQLALNMHHD